MPYTTAYPASLASGAIYGDPTVFNASGTYTIPPTASVNSTIIVEAIGGGSGGVGPSNYYGISNLQAYTGFPTQTGGQGGQTVIGTYRLGFLSTSPAGQPIAVTIGSGGTGAVQNANFTSSFPAEGSQTAITNFVAATNGGASSCSFGGSTFITASGGTSTNSGNVQTSNSFMTAVDSGILTNLGPRSGSGNYITGTVATDTMTVGAQVSGGAGRIEWGGTQVNNPNASTDYTRGTGAYTTAAGVDAPAGSGAGGSSGGFRALSGSTNNVTLGRAGNGAAPGGGGGGLYTSHVAPAGATASTLNSGQRGGNGGAGRVRIYYQA
jgi:hypothetical protein